MNEISTKVKFEKEDTSLQFAEQSDCLILYAN